VIDLALASPAGAAAVAIVGIVGGLVLLVRGLGAYRAAGRVSGTSPSRISSLAVGEVLVSGEAEPIEVALVSPLQSRPCVYYRASVTESRDGDGRDVLRENRAVGFRVRDASGTVRVFPNGARFDVPDCYEESTSAFGAEPPGLDVRRGSAFAPITNDRDAQIAALLTVRDPRAIGLDGGAASLTFGGLVGSGFGGTASAARRHYREARIEPGALVTVVGRALPFGELDDPATAYVVDGPGIASDDPEIAADLAEAREAGLLEDTPAEAWGNAAIEGFGIGRPVRPPELDPAANRLPPAEPADAARVREAFDIAPDALVLAASDEVPLSIALGSPDAVAGRQQWVFLLGLLGAVLAIGSAVALAIVVDGGLR
jgi:hypothetical protein